MCRPINHNNTNKAWFISIRHSDLLRRWEKRGQQPESSLWHILNLCFPMSFVVLRSFFIHTSQGLLQLGYISWEIRELQKWGSMGYLSNPNVTTQFPYFEYLWEKVKGISQPIYSTPDLQAV